LDDEIAIWFVGGGVARALFTSAPADGEAPRFDIAVKARVVNLAASPNEAKNNFAYMAKLVLSLTKNPKQRDSFYFLWGVGRKSVDFPLPWSDSLSHCSGGYTLPLTKPSPSKISLHEFGHVLPTLKVKVLPMFNHF
jgi:hypothetical protein